MGSPIRILNPEPGRRLDGADRLASDLLEAALELPDPGAEARLQKAAAMLHNLDPRKISGEDTRAAFWINVYNAMRLHVFHAHPPTTSVPLSLAQFRRIGWRIGEHDYTLSIIHHGLLRGNRRPLWTWGPLLAAGDPRLDAAPSLFDPRIHFALAFGALGAPSVRRFLSGMLDKQLRDAEREYVNLHTEIDEAKTILVPPPLLRAYRRDFQLGGKQDAANWVISRLPDEKRRPLEDNRANLIILWKFLVFPWAFPEHGWKK